VLVRGPRLLDYRHIQNTRYRQLVPQCIVIYYLTKTESGKSHTQEEQAYMQESKKAFGRDFGVLLLGLFEVDQNMRTMEHVHFACLLANLKKNLIP
jgi:hypothetical protein